MEARTNLTDRVLLERAAVGVNRDLRDSTIMSRQMRMGRRQRQPEQVPEQRNCVNGFPQARAHLVTL
jgi:hypothetical protein